ncbi:MAG: sigma-54-dependent Fis family transcriptional regulator [Planctomycetia bacterium]|nr:sigma-54-dependent Fis family transcriptional regulator [Planctomycetia bacterium]
MRLLIVDDEVSLRRTLRLTLESMKHQVAEAANGAAALHLVSKEDFDIILVDLKLGRESGLDVLSQLLQSNPTAGIVVMTAYAGIDTAVEAMRRGAFDYLPKPFTPEQLRLLLNRWQELRGLRSEVNNLREQIRRALPEVDLQTVVPAMQSALDTAFQVAPSEAAVLLRGESGTGKGVLARAIHAKSKRANAPFITVHCPSLSAELLESDLFGHVRGAFTGAFETTQGKVAAAEGGTLFLDEIGDLPIALQPKLLRFLQEKAYERVGDTQTRIGDVRIITATNRDLEAAVRAGMFREDLLYRLNVIEITLPALRERVPDIAVLAKNLLAFFAEQAGKQVTGFTHEALAALEHHRWPGNLRELRNAIERAVILASDQEIGLTQLPVPVTKLHKGEMFQLGGNVTLEELEAEHLRLVLSRAASLEEAASILGIDVSTLYRKRKKLGY